MIVLFYWFLFKLIFYSIWFSINQCLLICKVAEVSPTCLGTSTVNFCFLIIMKDLTLLKYLRNILSFIWVKRHNLCNGISILNFAIINEVIVSDITLVWCYLQLLFEIFTLKQLYSLLKMVTREFKFYKICNCNNFLLSRLKTIR